MAIEKVPKSANKFWPAFFGQRLALVIFSQVIITFGVGAALIITDTLVINSMIFWAIISGLLIINLATSLLIFISAVKPTKDLMAAIVSISGERTNLALPNPNTKKNERSGFKYALQTIYEMSGNRTGTSTEVTTVVEPAVSPTVEALNMTTCGFIAMDNKRQIIYANKTAPIHVDNNGQQIIDLLFNDADALTSWLDECSEHSVHAEHIWTRVPDRLPNEEGRRFFDVMASYQKGSTVEVVLVLIDRTSLYIVDEENLDFISFAAHELRGPITVIKGYIDILQDELADVIAGDQKELFQRLTVSANRLSGYIDNILNTSRYDRRHLKVHLVEDTVSGVYDVISDDMKLRASSQNRLLAVSFPTDLPTIAADRTSLSEVMSNLIDNAIKYSNEGGAINVTAKVNGNFVDISVQDNGIGMPESVVSQLFQKFYRSHRSRETVAGTGIGLYISKAIVESHSGTISVRSQDGHGSTFTMSIPIYATVADKLKAGDNSNEGIISEGKGWIKNHSMFRG